MKAYEFEQWALEFPNGCDLFCDGCTYPSEVEDDSPCDTCEVMELINLFEDEVRQEVVEVAKEIQKRVWITLQYPDQLAPEEQTEGGDSNE